MDARELLNGYNVPTNCKKCGGIMIFKGVGEYQCEDCGSLDWDDYGKVRNYIEKHRGATAAQIEAEIGVSQRSIRKMLKESRIEIAEGSKSFMHCEVCGKEIRSGRFCHECEMRVHRNMEEQYREALRKDVKGYGTNEGGDTGHRRFMREEM
ncbi:MAG: hypothetical protein J6A94_08460 [Lachnospiraceae bacterium]|nr:hypothetical protein [Lachnospiraceae bacterium]